MKNKLAVMLLLSGVSNAAVILAGLDENETGADDMIADILASLEPLLRKYLATPNDPVLREQLANVQEALAAA